MWGKAQGPSYRVLLLVLDFVAVSELLRLVPLVCKGWQSCAGASELWGWKLSAAYPALHWARKSDLKGLYLQQKADEDKVVTILEGRFLHIYCLPSLQYRKGELQCPFQPMEYAQWTLATPSSLVYVGGYCRNSGLYSDSAYRISTVAYTVEALRTLQTCRGNLGVAYSKGAVYCSGGFNGLFLRTVEKYSLEAETWTYIGSMAYARSHFSPTIAGGSMYVAGGRTKVIEVMSLRTERFESLPLSLEHADYSVTLLHTSDSLLALQKNTLSVWKLVPRRAFRPEVYKAPLCGWESRMQPVYAQGKIWLLEDLSNSIYWLQAGKWQVRQALFRPNCYTFVLNISPSKH